MGIDIRRFRSGGKLPTANDLNQIAKAATRQITGSSGFAQGDSYVHAGGGVGGALVVPRLYKIMDERGRLNYDADDEDDPNRLPIQTPIELFSKAPYWNVQPVSWSSQGMVVGSEEEPLKAYYMRAWTVNVFIEDYTVTRYVGIPDVSVTDLIYAIDGDSGYLEVTQAQVPIVYKGIVTGMSWNSRPELTILGDDPTHQLKKQIGYCAIQGINDVDFDWSVKPQVLCSPLGGGDWAILSIQGSLLAATDINNTTHNMLVHEIYSSP